MNKTIRHIFCLLTVAITAQVAFAEIPAGYYNSLNGKKEAELKTAVYEIIHNFTSVSSYSNLPDYFKRTDVRPNTDYWWDMYSDMDVDIHWSFGRYMNREHSFPKSWWGGDQNVKAYTDLNHLYPAEADANMAKSNYPLGEVRTANVFDNGVTKVGSPMSGQGGGSAYVFEPDDEYKGDFARTYFYMVTCYQDYKWTTKYMFMLQNNTYPTLNTWSIDLLLKWSREDKVSQKEIDRNEKVYMIQNNRNPFIDFPDLAEYIWGNKKGEAFSPSGGSTPTYTKLLTAPVPGTVLEFGQVAQNHSITTQLYIKGENLKKDLTAFVFGANKGMFKIAATTITASQVNKGYWLNVVYQPSVLGTHEAKIQVVCDDIDSAPPVVTLRGECLEAPKLTACTALAPTDITSTSYKANWSTPEGEVVDYWIITRNVYEGGELVEEEEVLAENSGWLIEDRGEYETYSVQSVRLEMRSPISNTVIVDCTGIDDIAANQPLEVLGFDGMIRFVCDLPQNDCRVIDITGREVLKLSEVSLDYEVAMPRGIYFVVTAQHPSAIKVVVR